MNKRLTIFVTILACCSILFAWLTPLHYRPWLSFYNEYAAFVSLLFTSLLILGKPIRVPRIVGLMLIIACIPFIQWASGIIYFFGDAFLVDCYILGFACAILAGYNLSANEINKQQLYIALSTVLIIASVISTWICFRQWLGLQLNHINYFEALVPINTGSRPFGNIGQPNQLATLLCMGTISTLYLFERRYIGVISSSLLAIFLIFGVALTRSATPWLDVIFILIWCAWKNQYIKQRLSWRAISGWVGLYVLVVVGLPILNELFFQTPFELFPHTDAIARLALWHQFGLAVLNGPLWGYGWNQVPVAQIAASSYFAVANPVMSTHNILLDILIWNGPVLGVLIILLATIWICRLALYARSLESTFALLTVSFALIHGMLEFPLLYAYILLPIGLLLGAVNGEQDQSTQQKSSTFILYQPAFAAFLMIGAIFVVRIMQEYPFFNNDHSVYLSTELQTHYQQKTTPTLDKTILLTQLRERVRMELTEPSTNMTAKQLEWMCRVAHAYATPANLYIYAAALALNNQPRLAIQELEYIRIFYGEDKYQVLAHQVIDLQQQLYDARNGQKSQ